MAQESSSAFTPCDFGQPMRARHFNRLDPSWLALNHGSYGLAPTCVMEKMREWEGRENGDGPRFTEQEKAELLKRAREGAARLVGADTNDLVLTGNTTQGIFAALQSLIPMLQAGDLILHFPSTIYGSCANSLRYILDTHPELKLEVLSVPLEYPMSHADFIERTKRVILNQQGQGRKIRVAFIDTISSKPAVVTPWEALVPIFKDHDIISVVDGAHSFGQHPLNLSASKPDFLVSNIHKWGLGHRCVAMLYVRKPYQHLVHSFPTSARYTTDRQASEDGCPSWVEEFGVNEAPSYYSLLSVTAVLDFRAKVCGGEENITRWCHQLALDGGALVAQELGTEVMQNVEGAGLLTANMANVALPITYPPVTKDSEKTAAVVNRQARWIDLRQITKHNTSVPVYVHNGKVWTRLSAQIYNDLADFERIAAVFKDICADINSGAWERIHPQPTVLPPQAVLPPWEGEFGKEIGRKLWRFGADGSNVDQSVTTITPSHVLDARRAIQDRADGAPDRFMRSQYERELDHARAQVAAAVKCDTEDLVLSTSAASLLGAALASLRSKLVKGSRILYFSATIAPTTRAALVRLANESAALGVKLVAVDFEWPSSSSNILALTKTALEAADADGYKVAAAIVESHSAQTGLRLPVDQLVALLRKHGALSIVDGTHQFGQQVVDLKRSAPDFWWADLHCRGYTARSCAALYVSKDHQNQVHALPIGAYYAPRAKTSTAGCKEFATEFVWNGTVDWSYVLSVTQALSFREALGGEARITEYCHGLVQRGAARVAAVLGTEVVDTDGSSYDSTVAVRLPVAKGVADSQLQRIAEELEERGCLAPVFVSQGALYATLSAQVYNDEQDFEHIAQILKTIV